MGSAKWIGGLLGWVTLGPLGALLGFIAGAAWDSASDTVRRFSDEADGQRSFSATEQKNSFLVSLLVLSSAVIKADGKTLQSEIDVVRDFVRRNFGEGAVSEAMNILTRLNDRQVNIYEVGPQIARYMNYSQRLQLFHYLAQIAIADGHFDKSEKSVLEAIAGTIGLSASDAASVIAMFYKDTDSAYAVLEISP